MKNVCSTKKMTWTMVALCCIVLNSCGHSDKEGNRDEVTYNTLCVERSDVWLHTSYSAKLRGRQYVEIRPQVEGVITDICIGEGDMVRKGQVLFVIDQVPYKAELATARANVRSAQAKVATAELDLKSKQSLFDGKVVSEYDLQTAVNRLAEAKAVLAQAESHEVNAYNELSYTEVKSPVDGVASMIPYRVGALVNANIGRPLVTVSDDGLMYAYFSMSENRMLDLLMEYGSLQEALTQMDEVQLKLSNGAKYEVQGRIDAVSGTVDEATGAVLVRAQFDNPGHLLRNGASGEVVLPVHKEDCIVVPQSATYELQNKTFVYKVVDGRAVSAPVEVFRLNNGQDFVVESGLKPGDVIVSEGVGLMREGAMVKPNRKN